MQISRVKRSKSIARNTYDRLSGIYDVLAGSSETPFMLRGLDLLQVVEGDTVLEIGPGTGKALLELSAQVGGMGRVYGLDLSPGMLKQSKRRLDKSNQTGRVLLLEGDGTQLPCCNSSLTAVFLSFTLELFDTPEIPLVLAECRRVLQPGGRIGVVSMLKPEKANIIVRLYEWLHSQLPAYVDCRPISAAELIRAADFQVDHRLEKSMWGLPVEILVARKA